MLRHSVIDETSLGSKAWAEVKAAMNAHLLGDSAGAA
jgi:hypothetical protein